MLSYSDANAMWKLTSNHRSRFGPWRPPRTWLEFCKGIATSPSFCLDSWAGNTWSNRRPLEIKGKRGEPKNNLYFSLIRKAGGIIFRSLTSNWVLRWNLIFSPWYLEDWHTKKCIQIEILELYLKQWNCVPTLGDKSLAFESAVSRAPDWNRCCMNWKYKGILRVVWHFIVKIHNAYGTNYEWCAFEIIFAIHICSSVSAENIPTTKCTCVEKMYILPNSTINWPL